MHKKRKQTKNKRLSVDTKIIISLLKKQPQTEEELVINTGFPLKTIRYERLPFLVKKKKIVKEVSENRYALWNYIDTEELVEEVMTLLKEQNYDELSVKHVAREAVLSENEVRKHIHKIARKLMLKIGDESSTKSVIND